MENIFFSINLIFILIIISVYRANLFQNVLILKFFFFWNVSCMESSLKTILSNFFTIYISIVRNDETRRTCRFFDSFCSDGRVKKFGYAPWMYLTSLASFADYRSSHGFSSCGLEKTRESSVAAREKGRPRETAPEDRWGRDRSLKKRERRGRDFPGGGGDAEPRGTRRGQGEELKEVMKIRRSRKGAYDMRMRRSTRKTGALILDLVTLTPAGVPLPAYYTRLRTPL